jgi:hypothetical protein
MTETIPQAYFVPQEEVAEQVVEFNGVPLRVAAMDVKTLGRLASRLRGEFTLCRMPLADIVDALGETTRRWQSASFSFRQVAEEYLPRLTGYSRPTIARGLDHLFSELSRDHLWALLEEEFDDPLVLDEWRPRRRAKGKVRAFGPKYVLHIMAGNIPGLGVQSLIFGLLVKSRNLIKSATEEPLLTALFAQSLAEVCSELSHLAVVLWWKREEERLNKVALSPADLIVAYGGADVIESLQRQIISPPYQRLVAYGPRESLAFIARECATHEIARALAMDVAMYDQQGCLSPQYCCVEEGGVLSPPHFAQALAQELAMLEKDLPSGKPPPARAARTQQARSVYEMKGATVYSSPGRIQWTVVFTPKILMLNPYASRLIAVWPVPDLLEPTRPLTKSIALHNTGGGIQAIGLAAPPERAQAIIDAYAAETGVNRFCPIGKMQFPPLLWHHDGRPNLTDFVRWVDWEEKG